MLLDRDGQGIKRLLGAGNQPGQKPFGRPNAILLILHQERSCAGHVGRWLKQAGFYLDIRRPALGDALPDTMEHHAGAIIFGGPMSANDTDEYVRREIDWIGVPLKEGKPFFGICLGAQMLVKHLGGEIFRHCEQCVEIGHYPIQPTREGEQLMAWPRCVYEWHNEGFTLPDGAKLLATGQRFENQAFSLGSHVFGVQFHPEISLAMIQRWTVRAAHMLTLPGARSRDEHLSGHLRFGPAQLSWLEEFLTKWTGKMTIPVDRLGS